MELLTITHTDFTMSIECNKFDAIWNKARNNIGEQGLLSSYSWSDGVLSVVRHTEGEDIFIEKEQKTDVYKRQDLRRYFFCRRHCCYNDI